MKAILISIKPKYVADIINGKKTIEVRKGTALYKAINKLIEQYGYADIYVYCTKDGYLHLENNGKWSYSRNQKYTYIRSGKVIFKFRCYKVDEYTLKMIKGGLYFSKSGLIDFPNEEAQLDNFELLDYAGDKLGTKLYAIHISDLEIFDKPKELSEFYKKGYLDYIKPCEHQRYPETYKDFYESVLKVAKHRFKITKAPQSWCYVEVEQ